MTDDTTNSKPDPDKSEDEHVLRVDEDIDWKEAINRAVNTPRPEGGWRRKGTKSD